MNEIEIDGKQGADRETPTHAYIVWSYPEIYDRSKQSTITLSLSHTRAADDIRIKYDSERDGWVIEQATSLDDLELVPDWKEVAFVKAWALDTNKENSNTTKTTDNEPLNVKPT